MLNKPSPDRQLLFSNVTRNCKRLSASACECVYVCIFMSSTQQRRQNSNNFPQHKISCCSWTACLYLKPHASHVVYPSHAGVGKVQSVGCTLPTKSFVWACQGNHRTRNLINLEAFFPTATQIYLT